MYGNDAGIYELLATTQIGTGGVACQFQWTKKSGVSYIFNAPYQGCSFHQGSYGRLEAIYGRNSTFSIQLAYSWAPDDSSPENLTRIKVTHEPDGNNLTFNFGQIANTAITELTSLTRPDGQKAYFYYTTGGELVDLEKPGNNPVLANETMPPNFLDGNPIHQGNLPETYAVTPPSSMEVCGPRATISNIDTNGNPVDGACVDFDYTNHQLTDWYVRGVLNPVPADGVVSQAIQSGPSTHFVQWGEASFSTSGLCNPFIGEQMQDTYHHSVLWCLDLNGRAVETIGSVSGLSTLTAYEAWDSNNNLVSTTDARHFTTQIGYDSNGNVVELASPSQTTSQGTVAPTTLYDYDNYNNVVRYCDPANNGSNGWKPPTDTLCQTYGTNPAKYTYNQSDPNELYGCVTTATKPSGYRTTITFSGQTCGIGLATQVQGQAFTQADHSQRQLTRSFVYNQDGTVFTYDPDDPHQGVGNGLWTFIYTQDDMGRIGLVEDPDGVTSYRCYNGDGSVYYSETQHQNTLDGAPGCGVTSPPKYAVAYGYDADGDVVTESRHHNCGVSCLAAVAVASWCTPTISIAAGTTCKYYDGLDRLVEVKQPYDSNAPDIYVNPWITRYLYDLTGNTYSFNNSPSFSAYGNLFETEELLPTGDGPVSVSGVSATPVPNTTYQGIAATAFDGIDRPVAKYSLAAGSSEQLVTESLTWDSSPFDSNIGGLLGTDCNADNQCQQFDYTPNGQEMTFAASDGSEAQRAYVYDLDGRVASIKSGSHRPQTFDYNEDGNLASSIDSDQGTSPATLTYHYYIDGTQKSLDVSSSALSQTGLFTYSYRNDGDLQTEVIDDGSLSGIAGFQHPGQTELDYTYTNASRILTRTESGVAAYTAVQTSKTYNASGFENGDTTPVTSLTGFSYSAESELLGMTSSNPAGCNGGPPASIGYSYSFRGELTAAPPCFEGLPNNQTLFANGLVVVAGQVPNATTQTTWDDRMAAIVSVKQLSNCGGSQGACMNNSWSYGQAGRLKAESQLVAGVPLAVSRCYDAENHVQVTFTGSASCTAPPTSAASITWGPNGRPLTIGTYTANGALHNETLHWSGNQLLFTTSLVSGVATLDDIEVDTQGDILPRDAGYKGLTFYDRAPDGSVMGCHNRSGVSFVGIGSSWGYGQSYSRYKQQPPYYYSPCLVNISPNAQMPAAINWFGTPLITNGQLGLPVGQGGTLGMPRLDGLTDGSDTIQGVRSYDNTSGLWTAPDADAGVVSAPATQKSYMWNGNNPVDYTDPSGYSISANGEWLNNLMSFLCANSAVFSLMYRQLEQSSTQFTVAVDWTMFQGRWLNADGGFFDASVPGFGRILVNPMDGPNPGPYHYYAPTTEEFLGLILHEMGHAWNYVNTKGYVHGIVDEESATIFKELVLNELSSNGIDPKEARPVYVDHGSGIAGAAGYDHHAGSNDK